MAQRQQQPVLIEAYEDEIERPSPPPPPRPAAPPSIQDNSLERRRSDGERGDASSNISRGSRIDSAVSSTDAEPTAAAQPLALSCPSSGSSGHTTERRSRKRSQSPKRPSPRSLPPPASSDGALSVADFEVVPSPIVAVERSKKNVVDHTYRDFSRIPPDSGDIARVRSTRDVSELSFPEKVHDILSQEAYKHYISWMPHGRAFRILIPKRMEMKVLPKYFNHSRYSTFLRQLNVYGFKHITQGADRNCYYHEACLRGLPHLLRYMPRPKNSKRLAPDPKNEPNFYRISEAFPLPEEAYETGKPLSEEPSQDETTPCEKTDSQSSGAMDGDAKPPAVKPDSVQYPNTVISREVAAMDSSNVGLHQLECQPDYNLSGEMHTAVGGLSCQQEKDPTAQHEPNHEMHAAEQFLLGQIGGGVPSIDLNQVGLPSQRQQHVAQLSGCQQHFSMPSHHSQAMLPYSQQNTRTMAQALRESLHDNNMLMAAIAASLGSTERILGVSDPSSALRLQQQQANSFNTSMLPPQFFNRF